MHVQYFLIHRDYIVKKTYLNVESFCQHFKALRNFRKDSQKHLIAKVIKVDTFY